MIERSSYIAFLAIISIFPFMIFTLSLASFFNQSKFGTKAIDYLYFITPSELQKLIEPILSQFQYGKVPFLTFSTIILIYSASTVIQAARKGFQKIFSKEKVTNQILFRAQSILLMLLLCTGLYLISAITFILPIMEHMIETILKIDIQAFYIYKTILEYTSTFITLIAILIFYKTLAPKIIPLKIHLLGAVIATCTIIPTARLIKYYTQNAASYNLIYGSLSSIIITIIAMQIFIAIFFWGAELNGILFKYYQSKRVS